MSENVGGRRHSTSAFAFVSVKEKEKLYVELKQILARQPGPEAAEQLQQYKWTLRDKATKLKVILHSRTPAAARATSSSYEMLLLRFRSNIGLPQNDRPQIFHVIKSFAESSAGADGTGEGARPQDE